MCQVGTHNAEVAAQYVIDRAQEIADLAADHPHLTAEVDREQASGGFNAHFAGVDIASVYHNLTNVVLYVSPKYPQAITSPPTLLLNSHFDSVFGTKGKAQLILNSAHFPDLHMSQRLAFFLLLLCHPH